jgi:hypothetical protein
LIYGLLLVNTMYKATSFQIYQRHLMVLPLKSQIYSGILIIQIKLSMQLTVNEQNSDLMFYRHRKYRCQRNAPDRSLQWD